MQNPASSSLSSPAAISKSSEVCGLPILGSLNGDSVLHSIFGHWVHVDVFRIVNARCDT